MYKNKQKLVQNTTIFSQRIKQSISVALMFLVLGTTWLSLPLPAHAATKTWDGGCGANTNWSCPANWSGDTVPVAADTVVFDNTSNNNSTIDALFNATETVAVININFPYSGTITQSTTLHVTTSFTLGDNNGSYSASNQTLDMNGSFTFTGGSFTASSGSTTLAGAMTVLNTPTFNANGGTFTFDGSTTATLSCANRTFNLISFAHTAGTKTVSSNCSLPLGSSPTLGSGTAAVTLNGTLSGSGTLTTLNTFTVNSSSPLSGFSTLTSSALSISGGTFTAPTTMNIAGAFTLNSGTTWSANSGTINFNGTSAASLSCGSKTFNQVNFTHTGSNTKTVGSDCSLPLGNNPTIGADGLADVTNNGILSGTGTLTVGTAVSGNTLTLAATSSLSGFSGLVAGTLTISATNTHNYGSYSMFVVNGPFTQSSSSTLTVPNGADFNGTFTMSAAANAIFNAPSGTMTIGSTFTINSTNTFNANGGTVTFDGGGVTSCNNTVFSNIVISYSGSGTRTINSNCSLPLGANPIVNGGRVILNGTLSGSGTVNFTANLGPTLTINAGGQLSGFSGISMLGGFVISGGTVDMSGYTTADFNGTDGFSMSSGSFSAPSVMSIAGALSLSGGTFTSNSGTVTFDGATASLSCGNMAFNLVSFTHTGGTKTVNSDCSLPLGNNPTVGMDTSTGGDIILNGTFSGTGTLTMGPVNSQVNDLTINSGGVLSGFSGLVMNGTYTQTGGTVNLGSYSPVTFHRHFFLNSGAVFTAPVGTMTVTTTFTLNVGSTFNANGGTLTFDGAGAVLTCNGAIFNHVVLANTSGSKTVSSSCDFPLGNNPTATAGGGIVLAGTLSGSGTLLMAGGLTLNAGFDLSDFDGLQTVTAKNLTVSGGTTANFSGYSLFDINGDFTLDNGATFTAPSEMSVASSFNLVSGSTFNANGGTVNFDADGPSTDDGTIICSSNTFNLITFTHTSGIKLVAAGCSLPLGVSPTAGAGGSITLDGTLSGAGTLTTTGTFRQETGSFLVGFSGLNSSNYTNAGTITDFGSYNTFDVNEDFTLESSASFTATNAIMTVGGNFIVASDSTFNANNGTVILDGSNQVILGTTFNNLTKIVATADTLTFPAGGTETILGDLILKGGSASELLTIVSSSPGTPWLIDAQGSRTLQYLNVSDSTNINASVMTAYDSVNSGGNTNWSFEDTPVPPVPTPTPSPVSPASVTYQSDTTNYLLHPAGSTEEAAPVTPNESNNQNRNGKEVLSGYLNWLSSNIWLASLFSLLLFVSIMCLILFLAGKKKPDNKKDLPK